MGFTFDASRFNVIFILSTFRKHLKRSALSSLRAYSKSLHDLISLAKILTFSLSSFCSCWDTFIILKRLTFFLMIGSQGGEAEEIVYLLEYTYVLLRECDLHLVRLST